MFLKSFGVYLLKTSGHSTFTPEFWAASTKPRLFGILLNIRTGIAEVRYAYSSTWPRPNLNWWTSFVSLKLFTSQTTRPCSLSQAISKSHVLELGEIGTRPSPCIQLATVFWVIECSCNALSKRFGSELNGSLFSIFAYIWLGIFLLAYSLIAKF